MGRIYRGEGDLDRAAAAFRRAVQLKPTNADWQHELGAVLRRSAHHADAAQAFEAALQLSPKRPQWSYELARARQAAGDLQGAVVAYQDALSLAPKRAAWHYDLGYVHETLQQWDKALKAYAAGLQVDSKADERHERLLANGTWKFPVRRRILDFAAAHLDEIQERVTSEPRPLVDPKIFVYWAQGIENAPPVVRRCHEQLQRVHRPDQLVVLDQSIWETVDISPVTWERVKDRPAHASDILRLELLSRHGGIWVDATCFVRSSLLEATAPLASTGLFAFERRPYAPANWFFVSTPGNYVVTTLRAALDVYWQHFDRLIDYYIFHHLFEALCVIDPTFRAHWEATPRIPSTGPHKFQVHMFDPYEEERYREILDSQFIHKLTYKTQDRLTPTCMLAHLLEYGAPDAGQDDIGPPARFQAAR